MTLRWYMELEDGCLAEQGICWNLKRKGTEKLVAIKSYENERQTRVAVENSRDALSLDLQRVNQENKRLSDQLKLLQETNRRLQEYKTSLQQYNNNLQNEANKNG
ncbi:hypothetical protein C4D60_Mb06t19170 [Musa balbisiana]|uniref:Uncharacterized protein n=1 Tax=Musa balbisiana TaxID=52838 RepID=A0A4S8IP40_MUSBA|nr:hypothetical protein C4D60_Mb06t19170 [Musa balbisiana]